MPRSKNSLSSLTKADLVRISADLVIVNVAFLVALVLRYIWATGYVGNVPSREGFDYFLQVYLRGFWFLSLICGVVFYTSGFYTYGKAYRSKFRVYIVLQAVSLSYLIFGTFTYFTGDLYELPRGAYFLAWGLTLVLMIGARLWAGMWRSMVQAETQFLHEQPAKRNVQRVLVIGGAGYIGSGLLRFLLEKGYKVRLLDRLMFGSEPISAYQDNPNLEVVDADFRQIDKVVEAMRDVDACIHLGALVGDPACAYDEQLTIDINLMATKLLAEVAKGRGVERFVFASTCSVYGASDDVLNEQSSLNPVSLYAKSKIASEKVLMQMADERFAPVILRFGTVYGLSGRTRFDLVINLLTAKAIVDKKITVFGGDQWRPFVHVNDVALAVFKALQAPLDVVNGEIFNVGSDEQNYTINAVGELIQKLIPNAELLNMGNDGDARNYKVSFRKIRKKLGFIPQWTVEKGIRQVEEAIRSGKVTDYTLSKYSNIKTLTDQGQLAIPNYEPGWERALLEEVSRAQEEKAAAEAAAKEAADDAEEADAEKPAEAEAPEPEAEESGAEK